MKTVCGFKMGETEARAFRRAAEIIVRSGPNTNPIAVVSVGGSDDDPFQGLAIITQKSLQMLFHLANFICCACGNPVHDQFRQYLDRTKLSLHQKNEIAALFKTFDDVGSVKSQDRKSDS